MGEDLCATLPRTASCGDTRVEQIGEPSNAEREEAPVPLTALHQMSHAPGVVQLPIKVFGDSVRLRDAVRRYIRRGTDLRAQVEATRDRIAAIADAEGSLSWVLAAGPPVNDLDRSVTAWDSNLQRSLGRWLGGAADQLLKHKRVRPTRGTATVDDLFAHIDEHVEARVKELTAILARLPTSSDQQAAPATPFNELRASGLVDEVQLNAYLRRMSQLRTRPQISAAIGAAKELVEAALRAALAVLSPTEQPDHDFAKLAKQVRRRLEETRGGEEEPAGEATRQMLVGFTNLQQALVTLRNQVGSGHGKPKLPVGLARRHAFLALDVAQAYTRYLTLSLVDSRLITLLPGG